MKGKKIGGKMREAQKLPGASIKQARGAAPKGGGKNLKTCFVNSSKIPTGSHAVNRPGRVGT